MKKKIERFTKVYVFDVNPGNDDVTKELIMGKLSRMMKNVSLYHYLVIVSHSSLKVLKKIIADAKIAFGYIVSDCGARIYEIASKKIIYEARLHKNDISGIFHSLIMSDMLALFSTSNNEYCYSFDQMNRYILAKMHYINISEQSGYANIKNVIDRNNIYSIMAFQKNTLEFNEKYQNFLNAAKDWHVNVTRLMESAFLIYNADASKYNAVLKIMELNRISNFKDVYYYGINSIDFQCYNNFTNHLVSAAAFYEAKNISSSIYTVSYESIINELNLSLSDNVENKVKQSNIFLNPNSSINNYNEQTFDLKNLENPKK